MEVQPEISSGKVSERRRHLEQTRRAQGSAAGGANHTSCGDARPAGELHGAEPRAAGGAGAAEGEGRRGARGDGGGANKLGLHDFVFDFFGRVQTYSEIFVPPCLDIEY
jgi:hypothetical protein